MEASIYNLEGKKTDSLSLPEEVFGVGWNADLVHQVVLSLTSSKRKSVAHTKDRSDVRGGGKKPWRQKGTGRARHGSTRSPIWVGGGVTHGPRKEKNYERTVSKKMRAKTLYTLLSQKMRDGEILFVDSLSLSEPKTREALKSLKAISAIKGFESISSKKRNSAVIALATKDKDIERSFSNIGNVEVLEARNLHPLALLQYKYLVLEDPKKSLETLPGRSLFAKKREKKESPKAKSLPKKKPQTKKEPVAA